ncbi:MULTISPECIES: flagellar biosynthesis protein FliQ [Nitrosococcus]|uniref:Flagellar biosynthetic protein FliQ n=3 Tax=Nitrosococcus TaxID=1227 RepID=Q3J975_NITOC|nr:MULTISPECIES: flagellar biosynthesis protein FliQ [Nitrosococcus]KFI18922.1 flagellar biosynthetic protein FliQ [Nitrosococcus oceani C-27]ABA58621.1 Flagellar biosynthesis protein FliQ [Nitrosococcus oceani ATCC 19707]ADJ27868.1 flagellar biosynthetic protein FliQ [Nitrosococcus watsonii C-113]EDZ68494.1 flagellar biosynthetic protein FliQ [Nitrosococcus oceani AFC27]KFI22204.1 flagellar biosynthetic protein FliQ [Nitrosococcus oceani]
MTADIVLSLLRHSLELLALLLAVLLLPSLAVGVLVSMFQAATQINEMTLSFIPKLLAVLLTLGLAGPWMLQLVLDHSRQIFENIPTLIG